MELPWQPWRFFSRAYSTSTIAEAGCQS
jgi:hypothetical protein